MSKDDEGQADRQRDQEGKNPRGRPGRRIRDEQPIQPPVAAHAAAATGGTHRRRRSTTAPAGAFSAADTGMTKVSATGKAAADQIGREVVHEDERLPLRRARSRSCQSSICPACCGRSAYRQARRNPHRRAGQQDGQPEGNALTSQLHLRPTSATRHAAAAEPQRLPAERRQAIAGSSSSSSTSLASLQLGQPGIDDGRAGADQRPAARGSAAARSRSSQTMRSVQRRPSRSSRTMIGRPVREPRTRFTNSSPSISLRYYNFCSGAIMLHKV